MNYILSINAPTILLVIDKLRQKSVLCTAIGKPTLRHVQVFLTNLGMEEETEIRNGENKQLEVGGGSGRIAKGV